MENGSLHYGSLAPPWIPWIVGPMIPMERRKASMEAGVNWVRDQCSEVKYLSGDDDDDDDDDQTS